MVKEFSNKYKYNIQLSFPKLYPIDLFFFYCRLNEEGKYVQNTNDNNLILKYDEGPKFSRNKITKNLFNEIDFQTLIKESIEEKSFKNCIKKIALQILKQFNINYEINFDLYKKLNVLISSQNSNLSNFKKEILIHLKDLYDMSIELDNNINKNSNYNFYNFEDYNIIRENKIDSSECYNNYPVLYYWLKKNSIFKNGKVFFKNLIEGEIFPFWLFCLRIHSSINYISWNYHSDLDMKYREKLCSLLMNKNKINTIGTKWINLLEPYFSKDNEDDFLNIMSDFIKKLRENDIFDINIKKNKVYQKIINSSILEKTNKMIELTFSDKNEEILKNENDIFLFFKDLKKNIKEILNSKIKDKYKIYFINGKFYKELIVKI